MSKLTVKFGGPSQTYSEAVSEAVSPSDQITPHGIQREALSEGASPADAVQGSVNLQPSSDYPNEPSGFTTIARQGWSNSTVSDPATESDFTSPETGTVWWTAGLGNTEIATDGTAPAGSGKIMRGVFPDGHDSGVSPWRFDLWSDTAKEEFDEIYVSLWMKIEGIDYENQGVGTKMFYVHNMDGKSFIMLHNGTGSQAIQTEMLPVLYQTNIQPDGSSAGTLQRWPNLTGDTVKWQVGQWTHLELYMKANTIGSSDGIFRMWLNGTQTYDLTDREWRTAENPDTFEHLQFTPVWGGTSGTKTRDDFWRIAELYISRS